MSKTPKEKNLQIETKSHFYAVQIISFLHSFDLDGAAGGGGVCKCKFTCAHAVLMERAESNLWVEVFSFYHMGRKQVERLNSGHHQLGGDAFKCH